MAAEIGGRHRQAVRVPAYTVVHQDAIAGHRRYEGADFGQHPARTSAHRGPRAASSYTAWDQRRPHCGRAMQIATQLRDHLRGIAYLIGMRRGRIPWPLQFFQHSRRQLPWIPGGNGTSAASGHEHGDIADVDRDRGCPRPVPRARRWASLPNPPRQKRGVKRAQNGQGSPRWPSIVTMLSSPRRRIPSAMRDASGPSPTTTARRRGLNCVSTAHVSRNRSWSLTGTKRATMPIRGSPAGSPSAGRRPSRGRSRRFPAPIALGSRVRCASGTPSSRRQYARTASLLPKTWCAKRSARASRAPRPRLRRIVGQRRWPASRTARAARRPDGRQEPSTAPRW